MHKSHSLPAFRLTIPYLATQLQNLIIKLRLSSHSARTMGYPSFACTQHDKLALSSDRRKHLNYLLHDYSEVSPHILRGRHAYKGHRRRRSWD